MILELRHNFNPRPLDTYSSQNQSFKPIINWMSTMWIQKWHTYLHSKMEQECRLAERRRVSGYIELSLSWCISLVICIGSFAGAQFIVALFSSAPWKTAESNIKLENRLLCITKWSAMKAWNSLSPASMLVINAMRTL